MDLQRADPQENERRRILAVDVVESFVRAGLPAHVSGEGTPTTGVAVEVDPFAASEGGGVFASWIVSEHLVDEFKGPLLSEKFDHPSIALHGAIVEAMTCALEAVLSASGFDVARPDSEYRADSLQVLSGPHPA